MKIDTYGYRINGNLKMLFGYDEVQAIEEFKRVRKPGMILVRISRDTRVPDAVYEKTIYVE